MDYLATLWQHLTESVCQEVFQLLRTHERQRKWSLFALLLVWVGLLSSAARTQTQAVEECGKGNPFFPDVEATSECPKSFASSLSLSGNDFPEILVLDGSKLHKVARLLKVARTTTAAI